MKKNKYLNTVGDGWLGVTLQDLQEMKREDLIQHLELRGCACYDDESTQLLREAAIEDWEGEL